MFHMTERIISLANIANWPELSRVPVDGVRRCWKLSVQAAAIGHEHNLERWRALTSARNIHELTASPYVNSALIEKILTYWWDLYEVIWQTQSQLAEFMEKRIDEFNSGFSASDSPENGLAATQWSSSEDAALEADTPPRVVKKDRLRATVAVNVNDERRFGQ